MLGIIARSAGYHDGFLDIWMDKVSVAPFASAIHKTCMFEICDDISYFWWHLLSLLFAIALQPLVFGIRRNSVERILPAVFKDERDRFGKASPALNNGSPLSVCAGYFRAVGDVPVAIFFYYCRKLVPHPVLLPYESHWLTDRFATSIRERRALFTASSVETLSPHPG
jgi:hypothetical protein